MVPSQASFTDNTTFFFRDTLVINQACSPAFLYFMKIFQCYIPSSLIKIFLYAMNTDIFITKCIWYRIKTKKVINWEKFWTINSSNNVNLVSEAFRKDPILFQRAKLWEGFGFNNRRLICLKLTDEVTFSWVLFLRTAFISNVAVNGYLCHLLLIFLVHLLSHILRLYTYFKNIFFPKLFWTTVFARLKSWIETFRKLGVIFGSFFRVTIFIILSRLKSYF